MKRLGFNKYYIHIYNIYYDIKKVRLIKLSRIEIDKLANEFLVLESFFKLSNHSRKNMFSYSVLIYILLKTNKYKTYKYVILPKKPQHIVKSIKTHCYVLKPPYS